jgi:hypothetical protein
MLPDDEGERGFAQALAESPLPCMIACALLIAGVALALWKAWIPSGLGWRWLSGVVLVAVALICLCRINSLPHRLQGTGLGLCRRRRASLLMSAVSFFVCAGLAAVLAWKLRRQPLLDSVVYPAGFAVGFLVAAGFKLSRYRREGRELRRLQGRCEECGYDLRGLPEPRCPECGTAFTPGHTSE